MGYREHGPNVIGKGAEPCRRLACERGPFGHAPVEEQERGYLCWRRGFFILSALDFFEKPASRRAMVRAFDAGCASWLAEPNPLIIAEEWAQALRTPFADLRR